jgi:hypothetical protein
MDWDLTYTYNTTRKNNEHYHEFELLMGQEFRAKTRFYINIEAKVEIGADFWNAKQ